MKFFSSLARLLGLDDGPIDATGPSPDPETPVGAKALALVGVLDELVSLLQADGENHWSLWMREASHRIRANEFRGIKKVLGAYGGMGSFNDLIIGQSSVDGRLVLSDDIDALNGTLSGLRSSAYDLAVEIREMVTAGR